MNCSHTLAVRHSGPADIGNVHKKRFIGLDCGIAVNSDGECVRRLPGGNKLIRQTLSDIIMVGSSRGVVLGCNIESNVSALSRRGQRDRESCRRGAAISFGRGHIINGEIRRRATCTVVGGRSGVAREWS